MKVLLVDACRNEPGKRSGTRGGIDADNAPRPPSGVAALFSCRAGEVAHESDKVKHGIFFHHVLESLKGEAANRKGEVTFASMASYVSQSVAADVPKLIGDGARQSPNLKADYSTEPVLLSVSVPSTPPPSLPKVEPPSPPTGKTLSGKQVTLDLGGGQKLELMRIPAGDFMMGAPDSDEGATRDLKPRHQVQIKHDFYLGKTEVTQEQYQQVMGKNPSWFCATGQHKAKVQGLDTKRFPVEGVGFDDAMEFCQKVSASTGHKVTLPTEAQWEYACRAGSQTKFTSATRSASSSPIAKSMAGRGTILRTKRSNARRRWARITPTFGACATCTATCGNGAWIGTTKKRITARPATNASGPAASNRCTCSAAAPGASRPTARSRRCDTSECRMLGIMTWV
jgi:formylglycine-generating enzyme required for sulfatase activity